MRFISSSRRFAFACAVAFAATAMGCDGPAAPHRLSTAGEGRKIGDFALRLDNLALPDTMRVRDTLRVEFTIGEGRDPCSFASTAWVSGTRKIFLVAAGVEHPGRSCRATIAALPVGVYWFSPPDSTRGAKVYRRPDPVTYRVNVCQPDGSIWTKNLVVRVPWPTRGVERADTSTALSSQDLDECRSLVRMASR